MITNKTKRKIEFKRKHLKNYKQKYTPEKLQECIQGVIDKKYSSITEASIKSGIPRRTIGHRVNKIINNETI